MTQPATQAHPHLTPRADKRRAERTSVSLPVFIEAGGCQCSARLQNISRTGAMIELLNPPSVGCAVRLNCGTIDVTAAVKWCREDSAGIEFTSPVADTDLSLQIMRSNAAALRRSMRTIDPAAA